MQFGTFSVGEVTTDPTGGRTVSEAERIASMTQLALKAEKLILSTSTTLITTDDPGPDAPHHLGEPARARIEVTA